MVLSRRVCVECWLGGTDLGKESLVELGRTTTLVGWSAILAAEFALQPTPPCDVILGLNFFVDNDLEFTLTGGGGSLSGKLAV